VKVERRPINAHLRAPFVSARGTIHDLSLALVAVTDDTGLVGRGETVDDAQWDLAGRRAGQPVWQLLGAAGASAVEVNATIAAPDRASAASAAAAARDAGYRCVKVKVGLGDDAGRLAAVRAAAGPDMAIRIDANGCWSPSEALAALRAFEPVGIELCEQPAADVEACAEVAASSPIPVSLDESAAEALEHRVCDAVCLKVSRLAGISGLVFAARRARQAGYRVYLASMLDGPLGIAAALHVAAVVEPDYACGLATLGLFDRPDPLQASGGRIAVPEGPGLGDGLLDWYLD
jgi:L-alanine-DL-glutamate epimerase-like enolase superfamily enzyme